MTIASRRARRRDSAFRAALAAAMLVTVGTLVLIILYIVFRGLVSDTVVDSPFLRSDAPAIALPDSGGTIAVIVNAGVRVSVLTAEQLSGLFGGAMGNWGDLSGQDLPVQPVLLGRGMASERTHQGLCGPSRPWAGNALQMGSAAEVISAVRGIPGAIGWIPLPEAPGTAVPAPVGVRTVRVRERVVLVNPSVTALSEGRRLSWVSQSQLGALLRGQVANWKEVGGRDLAVNLVEDADPESVRARVAAQQGALGLCPWSEVAGTSPAFLDVRTRELKPNLTLAYVFEEPRRAGKVGGVSTIILNTVFMILLTLLFTTPIGVGAALYLTEYARRRRLVSVLRFGVETLAGVPSIIFGLFGFIVFVTILKMGIGLISGTLTLTFMLLPTIIRTSEEALRSVPPALPAGSLALGATKWQTTVRVVVPSAIPGMLTGIILAVGRAVGETAALLFTMGTDYRLAQDLRSSARVLSVHLYYLLKEGISFDRAFATGTILVAIVLVVNLATTRLIGRMNLLRTGRTRNGPATEA